MRRRDYVSEHAKKSRERHCDRGNRSGLYHEEERPAIEKSPQRTVCLAKVDILAAGPRHHCSQFAVAERGDNREHARDRPHHKQPPGEPTSRAISADTMKIPEPIIEPATSIVESASQARERTSDVLAGASVTAVAIRVGWTCRRS